MLIWLYHSTGSNLVFKPFRPIIIYRVSVLNPVHRTSSLLSRAFIELVYDKMVELSGTPVG